MANPLQKEHHDRVKNALDAVGPGFCLAKWTQVTLRLHNGTNHSCHHPVPHKIPLSDFEANPSSLHNTPTKIQLRKEMLEGGKPKECDYCWRIERSHPEVFSDRVLKSGYPWSWGDMESVLANPLDPQYVPRNVEVVLGAQCNFKCSYCGPDVSTKWLAEVRRYGPYPTNSRHGQIPPGEEPIEDESKNPFIQAFWSWWPDLHPHLHTFRVTGGEPLLSDDLYRLMASMRERPRLGLQFAVNTNLCPPERLWERFLQESKALIASKAVGGMEVYTSAEAWGEKAEYIRHGMDFELWRRRLWSLLEEIPEVKVVVMATYNALSVSSFQWLLEEILKIKRYPDFRGGGRDFPIQVDISYLRLPHHQTIKLLTPDFLPMIRAQVEFMRQNRHHKVPETGRIVPGFHEVEVHKMERVMHWFQSDDDLLDSFPRKLANRGDFYRFFAEHDRRRGTNFLTTFPEYREFWLKCRKIEPLATAMLKSRSAVLNGAQAARQWVIGG